MTKIIDPRMPRDFTSDMSAFTPPPAKQASGEHLETLRRLRNDADGLIKDYPAPCASLNEEIAARNALDFAIAALSQRPVVDEAMVIRACNAYDAASNDDRPATYPWMHAALTAALAPQQPEKGEG